MPLTSKRLLPSAALLLAAAGAQATDSPVVVELQTNLGTIAVSPDYVNAPISSRNFVDYVTNGFYQDTLIHRVIKGFVVQGGGISRTTAQPKPTNPPIVNESTNGLSNLTGTVAMARTSDPNSATAQFYINLNDNTGLDYQSASSPGYAVFATVVKGMEVVRRIESLTAVNSFPYVPDAGVVYIEAAYPDDTWNTGMATTRVRISGSGRVVSDPDGIACGSRCVMTQAQGEALKLEAIPAKGSAFSGWQGDCSGKRDVINLDTNRGNHNCTAVFSKLGTKLQ